MAPRRPSSMRASSLGSWRCSPRSKPRSPPMMRRDGRRPLPSCWPTGKQVPSDAWTSSRSGHRTGSPTWRRSSAKRSCWRSPAPTSRRTGSIPPSPTRGLRSRCGDPSPPLVGLLQLVDLHLVHLQHGFHHAIRLLRVLVLQELAQDGGHDLPGEAELVLEPAAPVGLSALGKLAPEVVDLLLRLAVHHERDREGEFKLGAAVQRHEVLSIELEGDGHHRSLRARPGLAISRDTDDPGVLEDRGVEPRGLLGLRVEPQERGDLLHLSVLLGWSSHAWTVGGSENHRCLHRGGFSARSGRLSVLNATLAGMRHPCCWA